MIIISVRAGERHLLAGFVTVGSLALLIARGVGAGMGCLLVDDFGFHCLVVQCGDGVGHPKINLASDAGSGGTRCALV